MMIKTIHRNVNILRKIFITTFALMSTMSCTFASGGNIVGGVVGELNAGNGVYGTIGQIMGILAALGCGIAMIKILQIGMLFMIGAGGGKSKAKESLLPWIIGAGICILFGTLGPWLIEIIMGGSSGGVFDI